MYVYVVEMITTVSLGNIHHLTQLQICNQLLTLLGSLKERTEPTFQSNKVALIEKRILFTEEVQL